MTSTHTVAAWPMEVAAPFTELYDALADVLPQHRVAAFGDLADLATIISTEGAEAVLLVIDPVSVAAIGERTLATALATLREHPDVSVAVVVGDGYLGTDSDTCVSSLLGAAAVSAVRSLALSRQRPGRSNVICVPQSSFDPTTTLRGPLAQPTETVDIANALAFLLDETGRYVSGDVLFVNGGRHLFSSHTA